MDALHLYLAFLSVVFGLCIGSFLNVFGLRLLSNESIVNPPSKCPKCETPLKWYDNLPVISYLFLGGKCRNCKTHISLQYPIVEAFTAIVFLALYLKYGFSIQTILLIALSCSMIVMTITDIKEQVIYDINSMPLFPLGFVYSWLGYNNLEGNFLINSLIGLVVGILVFEVLSLIGNIFVGQRAFGFGDSLIAGAFGAWFGWKNLMFIIVLSFIFQMVLSVPVLVSNMIKNKEYKALLSLIGMFSAILIPLISQKLGFSNSIEGALLSSLIALIIVLLCTKNILGAAKQRPSFTFLPFGPALVFGAFVLIFIN